jgi:hypothetical protein
VKYAHVRYIKTGASGIFNSDYETKGGITFCYEFLPDGKVRASRAQCSTKENYCRRIGRDIARGRMETGKYMVFDYSTYTEGNIVDFLLDAEWK